MLHRHFWNQAFALSGPPMVCRWSLGMPEGRQKVIKWQRILRWGHYSGLWWWLNILTSVLIMGRQEDQSWREKVQGQKQRSERKRMLCISEQRRSFEPRSAGSRSQNG